MILVGRKCPLGRRQTGGASFRSDKAKRHAPLRCTASSSPLPDTPHVTPSSPIKFKYTPLCILYYHILHYPSRTHIQLVPDLRLFFSSRNNFFFPFVSTRATEYTFSITFSTHDKWYPMLCGLISHDRSSNGRT